MCSAGRWYNGAMQEFESITGLWSWSELCSALGVPSTDGPDVSRVVVDSRQVRPGDLFLALPGDPGPRFNPSHRTNNDGHDYMDDALQKGAVGVLGVRPPTATGAPFLKVEDTYDALWTLGSAARARLSGPVIAVTGSSGKTTAKAFLTHALQAYSPPGSFNNHIGVPLALINAPHQANAYVFEIGTSHPGEILPLAEMAKPDFAMVLNVHTAHVGNFPSWEDLKLEKLSIFKALSDSSKAVSEVSLGVSHGWTFGQAEHADGYLQEISGNRAMMQLRDESVTFSVPAGGTHRALTACATVLMTKLVTGSVKGAIAMPDTLVPAGRGSENWLRGGSLVVLDDSYNANPQSMKAALTAFGERTDVNRRMALIGEMLELGDEAQSAHLELAPVLRHFDHVICVGEGTRLLATELGASWYQEATDEVLDYVCQHVDGWLGEQTGSAETKQAEGVVVKGSNRVFWSKQFVQKLLKRLG